ncbi:MAG: transaldolase [Candidatus Taylorbacteria bacterium CG11_big_fil_rev_8_21_14_0_20_46_11]|uniref:Transaldolase n=1 Tax=Candidatus Taylorbacteria bacterium CG11_big_fil_rev_8_21_14_0_20_46_11 TaxID=1975025 RepID=A0A2H0K9W6_9BACT|nr:MAG: transaldolase [Candidatus Taylorbacteria bacterium CG11_big_fil_rev_8_21_14_0_20_46_11]
MQTKIFLDGGDPKETKEVLTLLGSLDGQTTNPTLIAKNPYARARFEKGEKFTKQEIMDFYKSVVSDISALIPQGSVSIEVYADAHTTADEMFTQGTEMFGWIPNAHIKFPTTRAGLEVAERSIAEGMRVNMTLVFTEAQAAAVHSATRCAKKGDVFVSPFVGRLDDIGENGMSLISNIRQMYDDVGSHVEILSASIRSKEHFLATLSARADIITAPATAIREWVANGKETGEGYVYDAGTLTTIPYASLDLTKAWQTFDIAHPLTEKGIERFSSDWNGLIQ